MTSFPFQVYLGAILVGVSLPVLWWAVSAPRRRATSVARLRAASSTDLREVVLAQSGRDRVLTPWMRSLTAIVRRRSPSGFVEALEHKVTLAGLSSRWPVERVLAFKLLLPTVGVVVGGLRYAANPSPSALLFALVLPILGYVLPDYLLSARARRRQAEISVALPDMLDQMTISVEAGLGFEPALTLVGEHIEGPIGEELRRTSQDVRLGMGREQAFRGLAERTEVPELRRFVASLIQADKLGVPLAKVLRTQAQELRTIRRQRAEEEAQKLPLKMIFPLILCILPALVLVLIGPAVLQAIDGFAVFG